MNDPRPQPWLPRKALLAVSSLTVVVLGFLAVRGGAPSPLVQDGIPIPFMMNDTLKGALSLVERRSGIDVYNVTFRDGEESVIFQQNKIYVVHIPNHESIVNAPLDHVMKELTTQGHRVNFFGYRYSDAAATMERRDISALRFKDRFPGQFFASAKAKEQDVLHSRSLSAFETANNVTFLPTDESPLSVRLDKSGSLYVFVVNEKDGATLSPRDQGVCGNSVPEGTEECDDGNQNDADLCTNTCKKGIPVPFDVSAGLPGIEGVYALTITMPPATADASITAGQEDVPLMSFQATGGTQAIVLSTVIAKATAGSLSSAEVYGLYRDTNGDGLGDLKVLDGVIDSAQGVLVFHDASPSSDRVLLPEQSVTFDIRANVAPDVSEEVLQLGFNTESANFIYGYLRDEETPVIGIRLDESCLFFCSIDVTLAPTTIFNIQGLE